MYEPQRASSNLLTCMLNEDSNQPVLPRSLIGAFIVHIKKLCIFGANAQADLNLRWAHISSSISDVADYMLSVPIV